MLCPVHGELLITPPSEAGIACDNVPATGIGRDQRSVSRSFMAGKCRAAWPPEQPGRIADFQAQIVIRHPQVAEQDEEVFHSGEA